MELWNGADGYPTVISYTNKPRRGINQPQLEWKYTMNPDQWPFNQPNLLDIDVVNC